MQQNNINQTIQQLLAMKKAGRNPQAILQMLIQRNPQYQQTLQTLQNMAQGKSMKDFVLQLAKQNGISEQNLQEIQQLFGR